MLNTSALGSLINSALSAFSADVTVNYGGTELNGTRAGLEQPNVQLNDAAAGYEFSVWINRTVYSGSLPDIGEFVSIGGADYFVVGTGRDSVGINHRIDLREEEKIAFTHNSIEYAAARTVLNESVVYSEYGYHDDYSFSLLLRSELFTARPETDDPITIGSISYLVVGTAESPSADILRIDLKGGYA